jgi:hypothetical protein
MTDRAQSPSPEFLASLDASSEESEAVRSAWAKEIERRARRVLTGESFGEPWEDARKRVMQRLAQR